MVTSQAILSGIESTMASQMRTMAMPSTRIDDQAYEENQKSDNENL